MSTEHTYSLPSQHGAAPWLILKVLSNAASAESLPIFLGKQKIKGSVIIDLVEPKDVHNIVLVVTGKVVSSGLDTKVFLKLRNDLYTSPPAKAPDHSLSNLLHINSHARQSLTGHHELPFSFELPSTANGPTSDLHSLGLSTESPGEPLPPTLLNNDWSAVIEYELQVHVHRGGFMTPESINHDLTVAVRVGTYFGYTPVSTPPPSSRLCQEAYASHKLPPGPREDPDGWEIQEVQVDGTLYGEQTAAVNYSLAIANPLNYTRGSTIPLILAVSPVSTSSAPITGTPALLSLLTDPTTPLLNLHRSLHSHIGVDDLPSAMASKDVLASARWWRDESVNHDSRIGILRGEIRIPPGLTPTFKWGRFNLMYTLDLYPPRASDSATLNPSTSTHLLRVPISISTDYAPGPRPVPHYPSSESAPNSDVGLKPEGPSDNSSMPTHGPYSIGDEAAQMRLRVL